MGGPHRVLASGGSVGVVVGRGGADIASYELLNAVNTKGIRTTADVASALGISKQEAARQLRAAQQDGLVDEEMDESRHVPADFERCFWYLTSQGFAEWDRFDKQQG